MTTSSRGQLFFEFSVRRSTIGFDRNQYAIFYGLTQPAVTHQVQELTAILRSWISKPATNGRRRARSRARRFSDGWNLQLESQDLGSARLG
jgi:hypothetical protein